MRTIAGACILAVLLVGCGDADEAADTSSAPATTLYLFDGLELPSRDGS